MSKTKKEAKRPTKPDREQVWFEADPTLAAKIDTFGARATIPAKRGPAARALVVMALDGLAAGVLPVQKEART